MINTSGMFTFLHLMNSSSIMDLNFLFLQCLESCHQTQNLYFSVWVVTINIFKNVIHCVQTLNKCIWIIEIFFQHSQAFLSRIQNWRHLNLFHTNKFCQYNFVFWKLSNALVFPDLTSPIINILYGWSGVNGHFLFCSLLFSFVILSRISIFLMYNNGSWGEN